MKLSRLWQPRSPLFWSFLVLNALSAVCGWALRALPLNNLGLLLIGSVGLLNSIFSMWIAWHLVRDEPPVAKPER